MDEDQNEKSRPHRLLSSRTARLVPVLALVLAATLVPTSGPGEDDAFTARYAPLVQAVEAAVAGQTMGEAKVGIEIRDVLSGRTIFALNARTALNPASTVKLVTAFAALAILRPEYTFETALFGDAGTGSILSEIAIRGYGDPSLTTEGLIAMVEDLRRQGISRVAGPIIVDGSFFDDERLPFAFDKFPPPDADSPFRAPVGAVSVNRNTMSVTVAPGPSPGSPARVDIFPDGYAKLRNDTLTVAEGTSNVRIQATTLKDATPFVRVWGPVASVDRPQTWEKRVEDPLLAAGHALKQVLAWHSIPSGDVLVDRVPAGARMLASRKSLPLGALLLRLGKESDNFYAEQILKSIGAESKGRPGSAEKGVEAVQEVLARTGIDPGEITYRNGSGLYSANLVAPAHLATILRAAYLDPEIRPEFVSHLATGGADGTLFYRYRDASSRRRVRAKTGTLKDTSALAGYVLAPPDLSPVCFAIIVNNAPGRVDTFRTFQEQIVTAIAKFLWAGR